MSILQSPKTTIGLDIEYSNGSVISSTDDIASRGMDQDTLNPVLMSCKDLQTRSTCDRPQSNRSVTASTSQIIAWCLHLGWVDVLWEVVFTKESDALNDLF